MADTTFGTEVPSEDTEARERRRSRELTSIRPHLAASYAALGGLEARAASLRGEVHALLDDPRQDGFGLLPTADGEWLCCGVADGLGAYVHSSFGADAALRAGLRELSRQLSSRAVGPGLVDHQSVIAAAAAAVRRRADALDVARRQVATTLMLAAVRSSPEPQGHACVVVGVGDSPALLLRSDGTWLPLLSPDPPGGPGNLVRGHLPGAPGEATALCTWVRPGDVLVLATDGFSVPLGRGTAELGASLAGRWLPDPRPVTGFLVDLTFPGHDDRTVAAVWALAEAEIEMEHRPARRQADPEGTAS